ncbi:MAG: hypothetical protein ABI164_06210 [Acidobacteriaceae bacterium]
MNGIFGICILLLVASGLHGQEATSASPRQQHPGSHGKTIFSRSATAAPQKPAPSSGQPAAPSSATMLASDAERTALTFSAYRFDVHLDPAQHSLAVHAHLTAQNAGENPLDRIALQLSSTLHWYSIHVDGKTEKFQTEIVESDIDHTGRLTEAVVPLPHPLAPGAAIQLDVIYSGSIQESSERLLRLGAPAKVAATSEWDRIVDNFTALRGFGNVIWFPVSTAPVLLGQGAQMFDSIGKWKLRQSGATVQMHVLVDYIGVPPSIAFLNGHAVQPDNSQQKKIPPTAASDSIPRVASFTLPPEPLGFAPLSFFVLQATRQRFANLDVYARAGNESAAQAYEKIAEEDRPLVEQWLGPKPTRPVILVDLPESDDLPFESRNILFLPLRPDPAANTAGPVLAHMLGHAYFVSRRPWLSEGVAQLMTLFWIERRAGRANAIGQMESHRGALALAETSDPAVDPGQSLIHAWSDIYYRDKAVDVLWMLRDIVGDTSFAQALEAYSAPRDHEPSYFQTLLQKSSGKQLEWFFDDWVYRDRGLPDLHIATAYRRPMLTKNNTMKNYLVSVDVENNSFCSAEVPVTVESATTSQTKRLLVLSHGRAALRVLLDSAPGKVTVNDGSVPEVRASRHEKSIVATQ